MASPRTSTPTRRRSRSVWPVRVHLPKLVRPLHGHPWVFPVLLSGQTITDNLAPPTVNGSLVSNTLSSSLGAFEGTGEVTFTGTSAAQQKFFRQQQQSSGQPSSRSLADGNRDIRLQAHGHSRAPHHVVVGHRARPALVNRAQASCPPRLGKRARAERGGPTDSAANYPRRTEFIQVSPSQPP